MYDETRFENVKVIQISKVVIQFAAGEVKFFRQKQTKSCMDDNVDY